MTSTAAIVALVALVALAALAVVFRREPFLPGWELGFPELYADGAPGSFGGAPATRRGSSAGQGVRATQRTFASPSETCADAVPDHRRRAYPWAAVHPATFGIANANFRDRACGKLLNVITINGASEPFIVVEAAPKPGVQLAEEGARRLGLAGRGDAVRACLQGVACVDG